MTRAPRPLALLVASAVAMLALAACDGSKTPAPPTLLSPVSPGYQKIVRPAVPSASPLPAPSLVDRQQVAALATERFLPVFTRPAPAADRTFTLDTRNPVGEQIPLLISGVTRDAAGAGWVQVYLPERPNGSTGWVPETQVRLLHLDERIVIDLSARTLVRSIDGRAVDRFRVGVGAPSTPSATGTFYVWAHVPQADPNGAYGVFALGISGFSPVLKDWPGGGRMAIHGTADPGDIGQALSHGCIRVYNSQMRELRHVPLGTPVIIRR